MSKNIDSICKTITMGQLKLARQSYLDEKYTVEQDLEDIDTIADLTELKIRYRMQKEKENGLLES